MSSDLTPHSRTRTFFSSPTLWSAESARLFPRRPHHHSPLRHFLVRPDAGIGFSCAEPIFMQIFQIIDDPTRTEREQVLSHLEELGQHLSAVVQCIHEMQIDPATHSIAIDHDAFLEHGELLIRIQPRQETTECSYDAVKSQRDKKKSLLCIPNWLALLGLLVLASESTPLKTRG